MITTLIKSKKPSSKMSYFSKMESLRFKMVSILFIVVLNVTNLAAQNSHPVKNTFISPITTHNKQKKVVPVAAKVYTFHLAKSFPTLEGPVKQSLVEKDDSESFDYDVMFCSASSKHTTTTSEVISLAVVKN